MTETYGGQLSRTEPQSFPQFPQITYPEQCMTAFVTTCVTRYMAAYFEVSVWGRLTSSFNTAKNCKSSYSSALMLTGPCAVICHSSSLV